MTGFKIQVAHSRVKRACDAPHRGDHVPWFFLLCVRLSQYPWCFSVFLAKICILYRSVLLKSYGGEGMGKQYVTESINLPNNMYSYLTFWTIPNAKLP